MRVPDHELYEIAFKEAKILQKLDHENIIKIFDFFYSESQQKVSILLEFARNSLRKVVKE